MTNSGFKATVTPPLYWRQGEDAPYSKLTNQQAEEIVRRSIAGERDNELATEFGVSAAAISKLARGVRWKGLAGARRTEDRLTGAGNHSAKLTEDAVRTIRAEKAAGASFRQLAKKHGVNPSTILGIMQGRTWKHVS